MRSLPLLMLSMLTALPCSASSPGMIEGPRGCDWEAFVVSASSTTTPQLELKLTKLHGSCMYEAGPCGQPGDKVTVSTTGHDTAYQTGQTIHVWVSGTAATLEHPRCTRTPIGQ